MFARVVSLKVREFLVDEMAALFGTCVPTRCFEVFSLVYCSHWVHQHSPTQLDILHWPTWNDILTTLDTTWFAVLIGGNSKKYTQLLTSDTSTAFGGVGDQSTLGGSTDGMFYVGLRMRDVGILVAWNGLRIQHRLRNLNAL